jgi:hypothetical protein
MDRKNEIRKNISEVNRKSYENNGINSESNHLFRQSFSYRICDDLCEVLLKYLSFEDKIKFECVSKQFQRCVYCKQNVFDIDSFLDHLIVKRFDDRYEPKLDINAIKSILNKCEFIYKVKANKFFMNREEILLTIANNCKNLKSIEYDFRELKEEVLLEFGLKCGQKLREISFRYIYGNEVNCYKKFLNLCPNLLSISYLKLSDFIDNERVLVPKVTQIKSLRIYKEYQLMEVLANCCSNTLKTLTISHIDSEEKVLSFSMKQISRLVNLEKLSLDLLYYQNITKSFIEDMKNIGINCVKIKSLGIRIECVNSFTISDLFNSIQFFSQIKFLNCDLNSKDLTNEQNISIKSLEKCKQLTHFEFRSQNSYEFFKDIDLYLPQLTHFNVISYDS